MKGFFADTVDTPKEGVEQRRKRECLKGAISKGKAYLLGGKWTQEKVDKASDEKSEKTGIALGKHTGISQVVKIRDVRKLQQNTENHPIIKYQMANLGCLFVCAFGNFLAPVLVVAHTVNNLDFSHEQSFEIYESDSTSRLSLRILYVLSRYKILVLIYLSV